MGGARRRNLGEPAVAGESKDPYLLFAAFRPVEHHPSVKIVSEINKAMLHSRRHEQRVTDAERKALAVALERAGSLDYDVEFIARMGSLRVVTSRRV